MSEQEKKRITQETKTTAFMGIKKELREWVPSITVGLVVFAVNLLVNYLLK